MTDKTYQQVQWGDDETWSPDPPWFKTWYGRLYLRVQNRIYRVPLKHRLEKLRHPVLARRLSRKKRADRRFLGQIIESRPENT